MSGIDIAPLRFDDAAPVARLLATAFDGDPLHRAAYGADVRARSEAFYRARLASRAGVWYAACRGPVVLGVIHWRSAGSAGDGCNLADLAVATPLGWVDRMAASVFRWAIGGAARDGAVDGRAGSHGEAGPVILGPLAVCQAARGRGIGGQLMAHYCAALDAGPAEGYLETAQPSNVRFYERFGFSIVGEFAVLGVPCVAMQRAAT